MKKYSPIDEKVRIFGRTKIQDPLPLFWTGSGIEFDIKASLCYVNFIAENGMFDQWIRVEINGVTCIRMMLLKGENRVPIFRGRDVETVRNIRIYKEGQAMPDDPKNKLLISSIETNGELLTFEHTYDYALEFVGDSLTAGEGLAGATSMMEWMPDQMSTDGHYGILVSKAFNAAPSILGLGGWGMYISWDGKIENNLPQYYGEICSVVKGDDNIALGAHDPYDFAGNPVDAVIINLGTNDASGFKGDITGENFETLKNSIKAFFDKIRACRGNVKIVYAYGMCGRDAEECIQTAVEEYKSEKADENVYYVPLPDLQDYGSREHPGKRTHAASAEALIKALKNILM